MSLTPVLFLSSLLAIGVQKSWTGAGDNQTETERRIGVADVNHLSIDNNERINGNYTIGTKLYDSRLYEDKYKDLQEQSNNWTGYLYDKAKLNINYTFNDFKSNDSSNKQNKVFLWFPPKEMPNLNYSLAKEKEVLYLEQNVTFQNEYENRINNTLQDEEIIFDWRAREDTYVITTPQEYPYAVLIVMYKRKKQAGICTGSILTDEWVLTASHCLDKADELNVYAGGNSLQEYNDFKMNLRPLPPTSQLLQSAQAIMHPLFKESTGDCDVALIRVDGKFNMTKYVNSIRLTTSPWKRRYHTYTTCTLTGFGVVQIGETRKDDAHRKTHHLEVKSPCLCSFRLQIMFGTKVASRYICTRPKLDHGVCPGDSGGGLVCDGVLRGVAMQLVKMKDTVLCDLSLTAPMQCGGTNTLSVFQDICPFVPWVNKYVHLFNESDISKKCKFLSKSPRVCSSEFVILFSNLAVVVIKMFPL